MAETPLGTEPVYTLGSDVAERERLRRQSDELREHACTLLDRVGPLLGACVLDLGCGPSGTLELLSERVGPSGRVVGMDLDPVHVAHARELVQARGLANVEVLEADATCTGLPSGGFDLISSRLLLVNIPSAARVVTEMARLLRPGGWVLGQEADCVFICEPPHPAFSRLMEVFVTLYEQDGADCNIGRRLPEMYRAAGLIDAGAEVHAEMWPADHPRRAIMIDLVRAMRPKILARGLLAAAELDELEREARAHLADPQTLCLPYLYFLAWARKA
jgi:SAM-dependent methyltransferase